MKRGIKETRITREGGATADVSGTSQRKRRNKRKRPPAEGGKWGGKMKRGKEENTDEGEAMITIE